MSSQAVPLLAAVFVLVALATWASVGWLVPAAERKLVGYVAWMRARSDEMFEPLGERHARWIVVGATLVGGALGFGLGGVLLGAPFAVVGYFAPAGWMRYRAAQRMKRLDDQLVDGFILMANGLKSSLTLLQAIELAATELPRPAVDEFGVLLKEIRLGTGIDEALLAMAGRLPLPDLEIAVHSILTLRQSGGNLSETFMTVANTIVDRKKVEGKIQALTAQGLYQGYAVAAMPFAFAAILNFMDPGFMEPLFTTALGWLICAVIVLLDAAGFWMVLKIVKVDV